MTLTFGERLRRVRQEARLTQAALAKKLDLDASYISRLETGRIESPGIVNVTKIARALRVPRAALIGEETNTDLWDVLLSRLAS